MDDSITLAMETRRSDVPNWDSFAYVNFIVAAEIELGVKFNVAEVESFETVGDIVAAARARIK
jgi:acyl carrier protein